MLKKIFSYFLFRENKNPTKDAKGDDLKDIADQVTRDAYIQQPSPITDELKLIFDKNEEIIIFDIGSCEGEDSIRYAKMFPKSKIFAFEPLLDNCEIINRQLKKYDVTQVSLFQIALSDNVGIAKFHVSSGSPEHLPNTDDWNYGNKSSSLLAPDQVLHHHSWLKFDQEIDVETDTLSNFCEKHMVDHIEIIHMDVQGAELAVLRGAGEMLKKIKAIWMEVENVSLYKDQPLARETQEFMESHGFKKLKDTVSNISGDHLYVRESFCKI